MSNQYNADIVAQVPSVLYGDPSPSVCLNFLRSIRSSATSPVCVFSDLACGTGYYAKELRRRGAARVVGVDLSEAMIRATNAQEEKEPLGVEYVCADAGALERLGDFDIVTGSTSFIMPTP